MIIIAKGGTHFIDLSRVEEIYVSMNGSIKAVMVSGRSNQLAAYIDNASGLKALDMMVDKITAGIKKIYMPTDEEVAEALKNENKEEPWHHATGKKAKRHGGS